MKQWMILKKVYPFFLAIIILTFSIIGCGGANSVDDIAQVLLKGGLKYDATEKVDTSKMGYARIDESIALVGPGIRVEILKISDEKTFKIFVSIGMLAKRVDGQSPLRLKGIPKNLYTKRPFVVIVRDEPIEGQVKSILTEYFK